MQPKIQNGQQRVFKIVLKSSMWATKNSRNCDVKLNLHTKSFKSCDIKLKLGNKKYKNCYTKKGRICKTKRKG